VVEGIKEVAPKLDPVRLTDERQSECLANAISQLFIAGSVTSPMVALPHVPNGGLTKHPVLNQCSLV
jgi:hypothetical protein